MDINKILTHLDVNLFPTKNQYYVAKSRMKKRLLENKIKVNTLEYCLYQEYIRLIKDEPIIIKDEPIIIKDNIKKKEIKKKKTNLKKKKVNIDKVIKKVEVKDIIKEDNIIKESVLTKDELDVLLEDTEDEIEDNIIIDDKPQEDKTLEERQDHILGKLDEDGDILHIKIEPTENIEKELVYYSFDEGETYEIFGIKYYSQEHGNDVIENDIEGSIRYFKEFYLFNNTTDNYELWIKEKINNK
tara:strand:- start:567 stop:1295 length:729 start_codon:yes stop_codon:yes gene_type:complete